MLEARDQTITQTQPQGFAHPLLEMTLARLREAVRQPEAFFWAFVFPALMTLVLGIAFRNSKPEKIPVAVVDQPGRAAEVNGMMAALTAAEDAQPLLLDAEAARQALRSGKVALSVAPSASSNGAPNYVFTFDPTRAETRGARLVADEALQRYAGRRDVASSVDAHFSEPGARYIDFLVPGLLGLNLLGSGIWGLGFALVQARIQKLLKRLAATPMKRWQFLLSYLLSRLIFLFVEMVGLLVFAYYIFGVQVHGSLLSFMLLAVLGSFTFAGIGLLTSARARTVEAAVGIINLITIPMWLLSGSFFSTTRFPEFMQPLVKALPLTALNDSLRAVMNDGASLLATWPQMAVLAAWALVSFVLALKIFRWQ